MPSRIRQIDFASITRRIILLRGQRVMIDVDLAKLYGVSTKALNQAIRRNKERFPGDFVFRSEISELSANWSEIATSSQKHRDPRFRPLAFTEHGAIMAATVLNSPRAVEMSVYVVRAFVKLRQVLASNTELARKQFEEVYSAIRALMTPTPPRSRLIGFTADIDR